MDGEEMEISKDELQSWIRDEVHKATLSSPGKHKQYRLVQSLLERRQRQATRFLELCQSVVVFENTVKELYSQLGWEYTDFDADSESGDELAESRQFLLSSSGECISRTSGPMASTPHSPSEDRKEEKVISQKRPPISLNKEPVVVLTKLTGSQMADSERIKEKNFSSTESDMQWEPDREMSVSESESSVSDYSPTSERKRKCRNYGHKSVKFHPASKRSRKSEKTRKSRSSASNGKKNTNNVNGVVKTSSLPATAVDDPESRKEDAAVPSSNSQKTTTLLSSGTKKTSQTSGAKSIEPTSQSSSSDSTSEATTVQSTTTSTNKISSERKETHASQQSSKATNAPPNVPKEEIKLDMNVLARRKPLCWQRGKVTEIITKEDGKLKYKVTFKEKGKILVSGHHLASERMPKLDELSVGSRVVVKSPGEKDEYQPGIMAELPGRKNRMRFLVYIDDHTPVYVGLPAFHVVYKPLENPLDDIPDEVHKDFMRDYLKVWPYPPQTQYKVGQAMRAEYEGAMQKCEVVAIDCSLVEVKFESDQHKEWLYRGSLRLEHMVNMRYFMWQKEGENSAKNP